MSEHSDESGLEGRCGVRLADEGAVARAGAALPSSEDRGRLSDLFTALADPTRALILLALASDELCVCELAEIAAVSQSAVSHQLRMLRDLRLVAWTPDGRRAVYRLADDHVRDLLAIGLAHASEEER